MSTTPTFFLYQLNLIKKKTEEGGVKGPKGGSKNLWGCWWLEDHRIRSFGTFKSSKGQRIKGPTIKKKKKKKKGGWIKGHGLKYWILCLESQKGWVTCHVGVELIKGCLGDVELINESKTKGGGSKIMDSNLGSLALGTQTLSKTKGMNHLPPLGEQRLDHLKLATSTLSKGQRIKGSRTWYNVQGFLKYWILCHESQKVGSLAMGAQRLSHLKLGTSTSSKGAVGSKNQRTKGCFTCLGVQRLGHLKLGTSTSSKIQKGQIPWTQTLDHLPWGPKTESLEVGDVDLIKGCRGIKESKNQRVFHVPWGPKVGSLEVGDVDLIKGSKGWVKGQMPWTQTLDHLPWGPKTESLEVGDVDLIKEWSWGRRPHQKMHWDVNFIKGSRAKGQSVKRSSNWTWVWWLMDSKAHERKQQWIKWVGQGPKVQRVKVCVSKIMDSNIWGQKDRTSILSQGYG
jgi:hypothetical protein